MDSLFTMGMMDKGFYYCNDLRYSSCPMFKINLKRQVNPQALTYAAQKTQLRYKPLQFKIAVSKTDVFYEMNDKSLVIKNEPYYKKKFIGVETNEYPWLVSYYENYICFTYFHTLFDGLGALEVRKTLLYYYFEYQGIIPQEAHDIKTLDDPYESLLEEEYKLSLEPYIRECSPPFIEKPLQPHDTISSRYIMKEEESSKCYCISIKTDSLIPLVKKYETTPFALLVPIISRSMKYLYDVEKPVLKTVTVYNYRHLTDSITLRNSNIGGCINYISEEMDHRPLDLLATVFRSILDVKLNEENVFNTLKETYDSNVELEKIPTLKERISFFEKQVSTSHASSFVFSYGSRIVLPKEFENEIDNFQIIVETLVSNLMVQVVGFKNSIDITITSRINDDRYIDNIMETLKDLKVEATLEKMDDLELVIFKTSKFI